MNTIEDLHTLVRLLAEFELPVSPILEYAIKNKEEELVASKEYIQERGSSTNKVEFSNNNITKNTDDKFFYHDSKKTTKRTSLMNPSNDGHKIQYIDGPWLFKKQVDKSVLKQGLVIRSDKQDDFFNAMGHRMEPRTSENLFFMVGDDKYEVKILYSQKSSGSKQLSVYYGEDLQRRFQKEFPKSYRSIMAKRENMEIKHGVFAKVDKGKEEYIEIYKTANPKIFRVKCIPLSD